MLIGHLPAGYIMSKLGYPGFAKHAASYRPFMFWGVFGSIAPDLDMFYFYLVDQGRTHHHKYFTHYPIVWITLLVLSFCIFMSVSSRRRVGAYALAFSCAGFVHLLLDSIVGDIWWLAPFVDKPFALATVPALYKPWWLSFILHWSFALELLVILWAGILWRRIPRRP